MVSDLDKIISKEKPINMFKDIALDLKMVRFEQKSHARFIQYKKVLREGDEILSRINMLTSFRIAKGVFYLQIMLKRIEINKQLFMQEVQKGIEVLIPRDLSQDSLPHSFRFYDQTINMIQDKMVFDRREFYGLKKAMALVYKEIDEEKSYMHKLGLKESGQSDKLVF